MYDDDPTQPVEYQYAVPRKRRGCFGGCFSRFLLLTIFGIALLVFAGIGVASVLIYSNLADDIEEGIAALNAARDRETFESARITDRNGELLWEFFGEGKRAVISYADMPQTLVDATVSIEDDTFFDNDGYDLPALVAALIANFRNPDSRPVGGSTITQQLVRHIAFDYEERTAVSYNRKAKELILAYIMSQEFSKEEILEMYLNEIYYGNLAYGVEAAAQTYFGKTATELSLAEATLLAGLPQSPVELDPLTNLEGAKARQWLVLNLMVQDGLLDQTLVEPTYQQELTFAEQEVSLSAPHFAIYVRQLLEEQFGADEVANGGLRVTTTLDLRYQRLAELMASRHVSALAEEHNMTNASLVAIKPGTGEILAMLGSVDYHDEAIDGQVNVARSLQQPGSAIKPLTYALAMSPPSPDELPAWSPADLLWDVPVSYPQFDGSTYTPVNYDGRFHGPVRLRTALANSYNVPAILLLQDIGVPRFLQFAQQMGIESFDPDPTRYGLSLTLGGGELTPLELTSAYAVFANEGKRIPPFTILKVTESDGTVLYESEPAEPVQVLDPRISFLISDFLDDDVARVPAMGRDNPLDLPFPASAKTGTTNDFRDNWTVGYTPGLVVGVWTGNTDNSEMVNVSGLSGAAPLWAEYMEAVYTDLDLQAELLVNGVQPSTEFTPPAGLVQKRICDLSSIVGWARECQFEGSEWVLEDEDSVAPTATSQLPFEQRVVTWEKLEPGVWRMPAFYLPTDIANSDNNLLPSQPYCHFKQGIPLRELPPNAFAQLFIQPPRNPESLAGAYEWALGHGEVILPANPCTLTQLVALTPTAQPQVWVSPTPNWNQTRSSWQSPTPWPTRIWATPTPRPQVNPTNINWRISSPKNNEKVSGIVPIYGTANFNPQDVQFYKIELDLGDDQWVTLGQTHAQGVTNGVLEHLYADALNAGTYRLRLVGVKWDGNYVAEPHTVSVQIMP